MVSHCRLLEGRTALITGSNRGIGKAILEVFAENGASIIACSRREDDAQSQFLDSIREQHQVHVSPMYFDLTDEAAIKENIRKMTERKERIDILVNNAGIAQGNLFQMTSLKTIREVFEVNFFSNLALTQPVSRLMQRQGGGSIINMASVAGIDAEAGYVAYGSSKAAVIYATQSLAKELAQYKIRVNAIAPGVTDTDMTTRMVDRVRQSLVQSSAMNRIADPREIANTALFLASDLSSFITGQVIRVDGGI
jgi:3-oxoacyl-[acyl-carrier protein] reductase